MKTVLSIAVQAAEDLEWLEESLLGKAKKFPSILTENGFVRALLSEARLLEKEVGKVLGAKDFRDRFRSNVDINWRGATKSQKDKAITALRNLIVGLPSRFAPGVRAVLDEQGALTFDRTHRDLGRKNKVFGVNPVFSLVNTEAVQALRESTSIFFAPEYERQATRFRARAQGVLSRGLEDGLSSRQIASRLSSEFQETAIHSRYWEVVAANHVNRARSFSAVATYAENGVEEYEIVAVKDERTTEICIMLDGKIFSVEAALDNFDSFEDAKDIEEVKQISPFLQVSADRKSISTPGGTVVARRPTENTPWSQGVALDPKNMNEKNIHTPPYHHACRTTIVPVLSPTKPGKPVTTSDRSSASKPPKPPPKDPKKKDTLESAPFDPGEDPVAAAKTPEAKRAAIIKQVQDGRGYVPGTFKDIKRETDIWGRGNERRKVQVRNKFSEDLGAEFRKIGRAVIAEDDDLKRLWNRVGSLSQNDRAELVDKLVAKMKRSGVEAIPEGEREKRKKKFIKSVARKTRSGRTNRLGNYSGTEKLTGHNKADIENFAGSFFDAWGPIAEGALKKNKKIYLAPIGDRVHNNTAQKYFAYTNRANFFHEFGHSIEDYINATTRSDGGQARSFWAMRVRQLDPNGRRLRDLIPGSGYDAWEKAHSNRWGHPYMGKLYPRDGSTEVVSMLSEMFGRNTQRGRQQVDADPNHLLEFIGYMKSAIRGEITRVQRSKKK